MATELVTTAGSNNLKVVPLHFTAAGGGDGEDCVVALQTSGTFTVTNDDTGEYTIGLPEVYKALVGIKISVVGPATICWQVQPTAVDLAGQTITISTWSLDIAGDAGAVATDLTTDDTLYVELLVVT